MNEEELKIKKLKEELKKYEINKLLCDLKGSDRWLILYNLVISKEKAMKRYAVYKQRRMDFIARITTEWPQWGVGFDFYKNYVFPFIANSLILHFVGYSDGFTISNINFQFEINGKKIEEKKYDGNGTLTLKPIDLVPALGITNDAGDPKFSIKTSEEYQPVILWSRGGDMGVQAFHIMLENLVRNSIKHSEKLRKQKKKDFTIGIFLFEDISSLKQKFCLDCSQQLRLINKSENAYIVISSNVDVPEESKTIDEYLCKPIVKETGERDYEAWGIKEMKIAAAFLSERSVDACNDEAPNFIQTGIYKWNGENDRHLAYCFVIPKFYFMGVLNDKDKYHKIIFRKDLKNNKIRNTPLLYLSTINEEVREYLKNDVKADIFRNQLPRRILIPNVNSSEILNTLPICNICEIKKNEIMSENEDNIVLSCYDKWINCLRQRIDIKTPISLSIFFQDGNKSKEWSEWSKNNELSWLELKFPEERPKSENIQSNLGNINLWRHIKLKEILGNIKNGQSPFYYESTSYHNSFFSFLYSLAPSRDPFLAKYIIYQIIESALLRILIIDDRVVRTLYNRADGEDKIKELEYMRIWVAKKIKLNSEEIALVAEAENNSKGLVDIEWNKDGTIKNKDAQKFDILFLHQTIFDDKISPHIINRDENWKEKWVFNMKKSIPYIIFHSGRGEQKEKLPKNVPFLEYSVLQEYVLNEPSKFFLTLLAMEAKGREEDKNGK